MASIGSILGGAFGLLVRRPVSVVTWAVVYCAGSVVASLAGNYAMFGTMMPTPEQAQGMNWASGGLAIGILLQLALLLLIVVLMNAAYRAILRPEEGGFAFIRLGMDEWRMLLVVILFNIAIAVAVVIGWLLLLLVLSVMAFALGKGTITALLGFVLMLAFFGAMIWVAVRLSLLFPVTFHRRRFSVDAAWDLTRGRFWLLFACYFLIAVLFFIVAGAFFWQLMGDYIAGVVQAGNDPAQVEALGQAFTAQMLAMPLGAKILYGVAGALLFAAMLALGPGLAASATRELLEEFDEAAEFAAESDGSIMD